MSSDIAASSSLNDSGSAILRLPPPARRLNFFALVGVIFFTVSGGAYGLEPLVGTVGPGLAVVLIVLTPLVWSLPIALMVSELASAMPEEGGYYVWVRRALGDFWGVQEGWWTICYTAVDMAIYPVLFVNYLAYFLPAQLALDENGSASWSVFLTRWLIAAALIAVALIINWQGARAVGRNAVVNIGLVLAPFVLLVIFGLTQEKMIATAMETVASDLMNNKGTGLLAVGLATVLWNYCGWDNVSTFAGEVNDPRRNYPRALMTALPLTVGAYLLPVLVGIAVTIDANVWSETAGWPVIANLIGGPWLGLLVAVAALISAWSLFNSQLLYVSRLPFVMARDGWLPHALTRVSTRTGVPTTALIVSCAVSAIFAALPFGKLVIIDILLYAAALALEFIALIALRLREPQMPRPFRVPGGLLVLVLMTIAPMCLAAIVVAASFSDEGVDVRQLAVVALAIASGPALYAVRRAKAARTRGDAKT